MKKLLITLFVCASAAIQSAEHAPVGNHLLTPEESQQIEQALKSEIAASSGEERAGLFLVDPSSIYYPLSCHWMMAMSAFCDSLEIEDSSIWQINYNDAYIVRTWMIEDPLFITQNRDWFSSEQFRIMNNRTGSSITANLSQGPLIGGESTRQIATIDYQKGDITLTDNSCWTVSSRDTTAFRKWAQGDYIIIGVNTGWDSNCPFILINSNINNFIRVKQF